MSGVTYHIFCNNVCFVVFFEKVVELVGRRSVINRPTTVRPSCHWEYCILFEQEEGKDYKLSLPQVRVHLESVSSSVITDKQRQGWGGGGAGKNVRNLIPKSLTFCNSAKKLGT